MKGLPQLYFIADVDTAEREGIDLVDVVRQFVAAGGRMVSLRPGGADDRKLMEVGRELSAILFAVRGVFLIHRRPDLAHLLSADGVHLPATGLSRRDVAKIVGPSAYVGRSCHGRVEVSRSEKRKESFVTLGPLFESISKEGYGPHVDESEFHQIAAASKIPVYALGGVLPENASQCLELGAHGIAAVGGIMTADDVEATTREYLGVIH